MNKVKVTSIVLFFWTFAHSQTNDSLVILPMQIKDTTSFIIPENKITNPEAIFPFFDKLKSLETNKNSKINIVHIGDSHIQADFLTGKMRTKFQTDFGNAGRGFIFPHRLAKTNGAPDIKFSSTANFESSKVTKTIDGMTIGLSGIALATTDSIFVIELDTKENYFTNVKVVSTNNENPFVLAKQTKITSQETTIVSEVSYYEVKKGDGLSKIARKNQLTLSQLKQLNNLKSNVIKAGQRLKVSIEQNPVKTIETISYEPISTVNYGNYNYYYTIESLNKICFLPNKNAISNNYSINGVVLENNQSGILYHNIGVNGARFFDFNKQDLFFNQLDVVTPDLLIVSFGTNESYEKLSVEDFILNMSVFLEKVRSQNPAAVILLTTPQPSYLSNGSLNFYVDDYAKKLLEVCKEYNVAICDIHTQLGGLLGAISNKRSGNLAKDGVHYSKKGYEIQADVLYEAIMNSFKFYKN